MDASHRGSEADLASFWPGSGGPLCDSGDTAMSPLVLSDSSGSTGAGCHGTDMADICTPFPRLLCSPEFWRESAGTGH